MRPGQEKRELILLSLTFLLLLVVGFVSQAEADSAGQVGTAENDRRPAPRYRTELFGKKYQLDNEKSLAAYIKALESEIERSKR